MASRLFAGADPQVWWKSFDLGVTAAKSQEAVLTWTVNQIFRASEDYTWVGIYMLEKAGTHLTLHPHYIGRPTDHTRIPVDTGICGAAVREENTLIIDDVKSDPRYLSCSIETRSEIVTPIWNMDTIVGEIDIDSDKPAAFDAKDREFLERIARLIGLRLNRV